MSLVDVQHFRKSYISRIWCGVLTRSVLVCYVWTFFYLNTKKPSPSCVRRSVILIASLTYTSYMLIWPLFNMISGSNDGFPVVEPFGSFTMDIFTPRSDLDLSVNFNANTDDRYTRKEKISVIRKFSKVLYSHQSKYFLKQSIFRLHTHWSLLLARLIVGWPLGLGAQPRRLGLLDGLW